MHQPDEAELAVIGAMILNAEHIIPTAITMGCTPAWFKHKACRAICEVIFEMDAEDRFIDVVTVCQNLKRRGSNGHSSLVVTEAVDTCGSPEHAIEYLHILQEKCLKDKLRGVLSEHVKMASGKDATDSVVSSLMMDLSSIQETQVQLKSPSEVLNTLIKKHRDAVKKGYSSLPSRWFPLQQKGGGYRKGQVTVVAARPGVGKSTFMCNEALYQAEHGFRVGIISLEMTQERLFTKMICDKGEMDSFKFETGRASEQELAAFSRIGQELVDLPLFVWDRTMDIDHIRNWVRKMVGRKRLDIVYLDYVQLIDGSKEQGKRNEIVAGWSHAIANTAKQTNVAFVSLTQISRMGEVPPGTKAKDRWRFVPRLHQLKESGSLEEDADQAILLYPDPNVDEDTGLSWVPYVFSLDKNRGGPTGKIEMLFKKPIQRFETKTSQEDRA